MAKFISTDSGATILEKLNNTVVTVGFQSGCDYVCDGVADNIQIKQAIDYVDSIGGGKIIIRAGIYDIAASITCSIAGHYNNIHIEGEGMDITVLKASVGNIAMILFGDGNPLAGVTPSNLKFSNLSMDMNNMTGGGHFGMAFGSCDTVHIDKVHFKNQKNGAYSMLWFGVSGNASNAFVARNLTVTDCIFSDSDAANEAITLAQALNIKFKNCIFRNKTSTYTLLNYGSYDVSVVGCEFLSCGNGVDGKGPTVFSACNFYNSSVSVSASNVSFLGCTFSSDGGSSSNAIAFTGYVVSSSEMFFDEEPIHTNVRLKNNKIIGCTFKNANTSSISSTIYTGYGSVQVISSYDLTVIGCSFEKTKWQGVYIMADNLVFSGNTIYNSGQLLSSAVRYNMAIAAKKAVIRDNHSFDNQDSPTATRDFFIDNQYSAILPAQDIEFENNNFEIGGVPYFYLGGGVFSATNPGNITIHGKNKIGLVISNSGTGTINNGATSATITHGLSVTPTLKDITVILGEKSTNAPGEIWVDTIGATTFNVNCANDPGASNLDFAWKAIVL